MTGNMMSAADITGLIAQITTSIVAIIAAWAALKAGTAVGDLKHTSEANASQVDEKLGVIHQLTNSNLTAVKSDLEQANEKIGKLQTTLVRLMEQSGIQHEAPEDLELDDLPGKRKEP